jgi:hypothetical protein
MKNKHIYSEQPVIQSYRKYPNYFRIDNLTTIGESAPSQQIEPEILHIELLKDKKDYNITEQLCGILSKSFLNTGYSFDISTTKDGYFFIKTDYDCHLINFSEISLMLMKFDYVFSAEVDFFKNKPCLQFRLFEQNNKTRDISGRINYGKFISEGIPIINNDKILKELNFSSSFKKNFNVLCQHLFYNIVPEYCKDHLKQCYIFNLKQEEGTIALTINNCIDLTNNLFIVNKLIKDFQVKAINRNYKFNHIDLYLNLAKNSLKFVFNQKTNKRKRDKDDVDELERNKRSKLE